MIKRTLNSYMPVLIVAYWIIITAISGKSINAFVLVTLPLMFLAAWLWDSRRTLREKFEKQKLGQKMVEMWFGSTPDFGVTERYIDCGSITAVCTLLLEGRVLQIEFNKRVYCEIWVLGMKVAYYAPTTNIYCFPVNGQIKDNVVQVPISEFAARGDHYSISVRGSNLFDNGEFFGIKIVQH